MVKIITNMKGEFIITNNTISVQALDRLPMYLNYLKSLNINSSSYISSAAIAKELNLNQIQVRKDIACVTNLGKPKVGHEIKTLINELEKFLGYNNPNDAIIVGAGKLGQALLSYDGFNDYGLNILAAFDLDESKVHLSEKEKPIFHISKLENLCKRLNIKIGIITVPSSVAQETAEKLVSLGIEAIWNFAPVHLKLNDNIKVQNENMASSLALLSNHIKNKM